MLREIEENELNKLYRTKNTASAVKNQLNIICDMHKDRVNGRIKEPLTSEWLMEQIKKFADGLYI